MTVEQLTASRPDFTLRFDGPAIIRHEMDVRELAPALMSLADLFQQANSVVNPGEPPVSLNIRATGQGSFEVDLVAVLKATEQTINMFAAEPVDAAANLAGLIAGTYGLFAFLKAKRRARREETLPTTGQLRITLEDGTSQTFPLPVRDLSEDPEVQRAARNVVAPLSRGGVEVVEFKRRGTTEEAGEEVVTVTSADLPAFLPAEVAEVPGASTSLSERELDLEIVSPTFKKDNKWRVSEGLRSYWVRIVDRAFLARVAAGEEFAAGDKLRVIEQTVQTTGPDGKLTAEYLVTRVLAHIKAPRQTATDEQGT